jgi:HNH endonuclease
MSETKPRRTRPVSLEYRRWRLEYEQTTKTPDGKHWIWNGKPLRNGYGHFLWNGVNWSAHRYAYVIFKGPIPEGLDVAHRCDIKLCCNPECLEAVTREKNIQDMYDRGRRRGHSATHCPQSHEFTVENTYTYNGARQCKECRRTRTREYNYQRYHERARI